MKRSGPELGDLSARFFAYVQLRKRETIRSGELASVLDITESQERGLLHRLSKSGWIVRLKRGVYLVPPRIPAGGKYSPGTALILQKLMEEEKGSYQICGPPAFNFYGFDDQVPSVTYLYNNRISGKRSIGSLAFQFIKVADHRLGAINAVRTREDREMIYSSRARTLMDAVYDWHRFHSLPRGYVLIKEEVGNEPEFASEFIEVTAKYGNVATIRRIGYVLDTLGLNPNKMNRLRRRLSTSRSLIPLIPGRSAQGTINRKWGIIING